MKGKNAKHISLDKQDIGKIREGEGLVCQFEDETVMVTGPEDFGGMTTLNFERRSTKNGNIYVFTMPDGREVELSPGTTVSELQNRI